VRSLSGDCIRMSEGLWGLIPSATTAKNNFLTIPYRIQEACVLEHSKWACLDTSYVLAREAVVVDLQRDRGMPVDAV